MLTYTTAQIAKIVGVHPNTIRLYENLGFISIPKRAENGYRIFTDIHIKQVKIARTAFTIEILQNGLRKKIITIVKEIALENYDNAIRLTNEYIKGVNQEIKNAKEAVSIVKDLLSGITFNDTTLMKRKDVSEHLNITMDTLRNWEMNGLLKVKRNENGYRVYSSHDIKTLKIIRTLKCANYSLSAILRMNNALLLNQNINIENILNTPNPTDDIISACDKLIISLNAAKINAKSVLAMINEIKNPPL